MPSGRKPKFTPEQQTAIVERYKRGDESISTIALTLGTHRQLIGNILKAHGVTVRIHHHALTPEQQAEVVKRFTEGETGRDLEKLFGVDQTTITRIVRENGGPLRRCGRKRQFNTRQEWLESPVVRLRKLLQTARGCAPARNLTFEDGLLDIYPLNPPTHCECCGIKLDYAVNSRTKASLYGRGPSFDRVDNNIGYTVKNVHVLCLRCNQLKNNGKLQEFKNIVAYMSKYLEP